MNCVEVCVSDNVVLACGCDNVCLCGCDNVCVLA